MKRHVALRGLSDDHHHGLVHARHLTLAAAGKRDAAATGAEFLAYATGGMARHFRQEEETLLPEYAQVAGPDDAGIARMLSEHLALRALALELRRASLAGTAGREMLGRIGALLESHIRFEERQVFPAIEKSLPVERLAAVGVLLAAGLPG